VAPPTHCHPGGLLATALLYARRRGLPFEEAWEEALPTVYPNDSAMRTQWRDALTGTKEEWRAAYEGRPTAFSRAAPALLPVLSGGDQDGDRERAGSVLVA
jgi:hypothetical protein